MASDKARRIAPEAKEIIDAVYEEALAGLGDDDRRVLQAALLKITENLKASEPGQGLDTAPAPSETSK